MVKFARLVKNEYIKIIAKTGTWVMIAILMAATVGLPVLARLDRQLDEKYASDSYEDTMNSYRSELDYIEKTQEEGWETEAEKLRYLIDNGIEEDWRYSAVTSMFELKYNPPLHGIPDPEKTVGELDASIKNNDWKTCFGALLGCGDLVGDYQKTMMQRCLDENVAPSGESKRYKLIENLSYSESALKNIEEQKASGCAVEPDSYMEIKNQTIKYKYRFDNNILYDISENDSWLGGDYDFWGVFCTSTAMIAVIGVMVIIIAGGIVAGEFSSGTVKFLMINPVKRWKILTSKYFTVMTFGLLAMAAVYIVSIITTLILFGGDNLGASYLSVSGETVRSTPGFIYMMRQYLLSSVSVAVMGTLAFAISSMFRSSALAIGVSVMSLFGGNTATLILSQFEFDWGRYLIFANTDIGRIAEGEPAFAGQTVTAAVAVIAVHMIIFLLTAWDGFNKREV